MNIKYFLILLLFINSVIAAEEKNYELFDLKNGREYTLILEEDLVHEIMKLSLYERNKIIDSLRVPYVRDIANISESQRSFLKVEFRRGGGSNLKVRYTSIYCVADSKIITSLTQINTIYFHVAETYVPEIDSIKGTKELEDYSTSMEIKLNREYTANLAEIYYYQSIFAPENNDKWSNYVELKFNNDECLFYSGKREVKGHFQIYYLNDSEESKELNGEFWAVELKKFTYLRIGSKWFNIDGDKLYEL